jgi:hypothetical protein
MIFIPWGRWPTEGSKEQKGEVRVSTELGTAERARRAVTRPSEAAGNRRSELSNLETNQRACGVSQHAGFFFEERSDENEMKSRVEYALEVYMGSGTRK